MKTKIKSGWIWMPHAGHFICGSRCSFVLNTYVNGYIVSTVGEFRPSGGECEDIAVGRRYETMVFPSTKSSDICCPYRQASGTELDFEGYNDSGKAMLGHYKMCEKWAKK